METQIIICLLGFIALFLLILIIRVCWSGHKNALAADLERMERLARADAVSLRQELGQSLLQFNDSIQQTVAGRIDRMRQENLQNTTHMRTLIEDKMDKMRAENTLKLDQMRETVEEKLHDTLEKRLGESFSMVSERLEKVHQGLGEMQTLAADVGGLKRVLTNVKARGTWGEVQLGALLEQMLAPDQFVKNAHIKPNTQEVVEFAVKLPDGDVLIPIDSKFPIEDYDRLVRAADQGDAALADNIAQDLERHIKQEAKRIAEKYIYPPVTTDFAIMFLPTEGLYAEMMRRSGLVSEIQNKYRISIAGPSTLGAFLNSLQMGFKTLAIQKRSGEVWQILNEVKNEFEKYAVWIEKVKRNLDLAHKTLDEAETRTRAVNRKLRRVEGSEAQTSALESEALPSFKSLPAQTLFATADVEDVKIA